MKQHILIAFIQNNFCCSNSSYFPSKHYVACCSKLPQTFFFFFIWTENNNLERTNIFFSFSISEMSATSLTQLKQFYSSRLYHPRKSSSQPSIYPPTSFTIVFAKGCTDGSSERTKCNAVYKRRWMWILSISKSNKAYDFYCMWESFGQCNTD